MRQLWQGRLKLSSGGTIRCPVGWSLNAEWSSRLIDFDLWFVWAGRGSMALTDGTVVELQRGSVFWMRPGRSYLASQDENDRLGVTWQHFTHSAIGRELLDGIPEHVHLTDTAFFDQVFRRVINVRRVTRAQEENPLFIDALFRTLLHTYLNPVDEPIPALPSEAKIRQQMNRARADAQPLPSVADLAREAGYHRDHYRKLFRRIAGVSPKEWLLNTRIDRAADLLHETTMTIAEIADQLGYEDVYHFSRQFKLKTGVSPSRFRRNLPPLAAVSSIAGSKQHLGNVE